MTTEPQPSHHKQIRPLYGIVIAIVTNLVLYIRFRNPDDSWGMIPFLLLLSTITTSWLFAQTIEYQNQRAWKKIIRLWAVLIILGGVYITLTILNMKNGLTQY